MTKSKTVDQHDRDLIINELDRNMLVEAAAGTGKTESMVGRMITLLRTGKCAGPENLAAVTFTRKAAAELRARFQLRLEEAVRECEDPEERIRLSNALDGIEKTAVTTIHAFCARLLRERPVEAGVDVGFREVEADEDKLLREEAWSEFCSVAITFDREGHVARLNEVNLALGDLESAFINYVEYPDVDEWPALPLGAPAPDFSRVREEIFEYLKHVKEINSILVKYGKNDSLARFYSDLPRILSHFNNLEDPLQFVDLLGLFDKKLDVTKSLWRDINGQKLVDVALQEGERWNDFREQCVKPAIASWHTYCYGIVMPVLKEAEGYYRELRRERGVLNFQDLLMSSARLLREHQAVREYFSGRYTHLLVDEFQDTDPIQAEILMLLTSTDCSETDWRRCVARPGSLFVVGDPKQSIYRFRRADIVTYNDFKEQLLNPGDGHEPGVLVSLRANFRSVAPVIDWANAQFAPEPAEADDSAVNWESSDPTVQESPDLLRFPAESNRYSPAYVGLESGRAAVDDCDLCGVFSLTIPGEHAKNKETSVRWEADYIARFIRKAIDEGMTVPRTSAGCPGTVGPADFMIINRNSETLAEYAKALHRYGLPVTVTGSEGLREVEFLHLLHSVIQAVLNPEDPVALVGVLRSEAFGVSDAELFRFSRAGGRFDFLFKGQPQPEPGDDLITDCLARMKRYAGWLSHRPAATAMMDIADDLGLLFMAALNEGSAVQTGSVYKAIEMVRSSMVGGWSAQQALDMLGGLIQEKSKIDGMSVLSGNEPSVRIMNLHQVKGLEAPVVILAGRHGHSQKHRRVGRQVVHIERGQGATRGYLNIAVEGQPPSYLSTPLARPAEWQEYSSEELRFEYAEELRLRYVAATRGASAVIVTRLDKKDSKSPWQFFALDEYEEIPDPGDVKPEIAPNDPLDPDAASEASAAIEAALQGIQNPSYSSTAAKEYAVSQKGQPGEAPEDAAEVERARAVVHRGGAGIEWGQAVHELLELAMMHPGVDLTAYVPSILDRNELGADMADELLATTDSVVTSELWQRASSAELRLTEVPFEIVVNDEAVPNLISGAIDLAFKEDGAWVIVDYKTDQPAKDGSYDQLVSHYSPQVRFYADAWEKITGESPAETGLFFTRSGEYHPCG